jgi:hypothetical protein
MLSDLFFRVRSLLRRRKIEAELDDELRFHFEREVEKCLRSGLTRDEALRQARLDFGGLHECPFVLVQILSTFIWRGGPETDDQIIDTP